MTSSFIKRIAQVGLVAKGFVYLILGLLFFMAAFEINGKGSNDATKIGALQFVRDLPAGAALLWVLAAGLVCYAFWRGVEALQRKSGAKGWQKRLRYIFSGLVYLLFAFTAVRMEMGEKSSGDQNQHLAGELMSKPFGQILVGLAGVALAAVGVYQIWYGLSEKYKKHVHNLSLQDQSAKLLLRAGKVGYISRGIVWLLVAYLFVRAAFHAAASEAGNTGKAFQFIEASSYGSLLLGVLGVGLMAYGIFNFVRARYERI
jgi:hypothetical protein